MNITLEQARAFDALDRHGTFAAAAKALRKGHTAVLYALRSLEEQTGLGLLDRRAYRTTITPAGRRVLEHCRRLLVAERDLEAACEEIRTGWEPSLRVVFDGIYPVEPLIRVVGALAARRAPTRIGVYAEFLAGVEQAFVRDEADIMISVLPPRTLALRAVPLGELRAHLVAHREHPLGKLRKPARPEDLLAHVLLTVRGSDPGLQLPTAGLDLHSTVHLNDFASKKAAILARAGFGWMPEYLIERELSRGELRPVRWRRANTHAFRPHLYHRETGKLGRAASALVESLTRGARD